LEDSEKAVIRWACGQLLMNYVRAIDSKNWAAVTAGFMTEAVFSRTGSSPMKGTASIEGFFEVQDARRRAVGQEHKTHHHVTTMSIIPADSNFARGTSYVLVFITPNAREAGDTRHIIPDLLIEYEDEFVKTPAGWRILSHDARHVFRSAKTS
jgi:hypothetical protein